MLLLFDFDSLRSLMASSSKVESDSEDEALDEEACSSFLSLSLCLSLYIFTFLPLNFKFQFFIPLYNSHSCYTKLLAPNAFYLVERNFWVNLNSENWVWHCTISRAFYVFQLRICAGWAFWWFHACFFMGKVIYYWIHLFGSCNLGLIFLISYFSIGSFLKSKRFVGNGCLMARKICWYVCLDWKT